MREFISRLRIFYVDVPALRPGTIGAYLLSFVSVGVATALRLAIDPYVEGLQFATFIVAVTLTTLIGGFGSGLFSVVLSIAAVAVFVLPLHLSFYIEQPGDVLALVLYTVVMLFNVALIYRDARCSGAPAGPAGLAGDQRPVAVGPRRSEARVVALRCPPPRLFLGCAVQGDFRRPPGWSRRRRVHELGASRR
jgi:hypothetical protein